MKIAPSFLFAASCVVAARATTTHTVAQGSSENFVCQGSDACCGAGNFASSNIAVCETGGCGKIGQFLDCTAASCEVVCGTSCLYQTIPPADENDTVNVGGVDSASKTNAVLTGGTVEFVCPGSSDQCCGAGSFVETQALPIGSSGDCAHTGRFTNCTGASGCTVTCGRSCFDNVLSADGVLVFSEGGGASSGVRQLAGGAAVSVIAAAGIVAVASAAATIAAL